MTKGEEERALREQFPSFIVHDCNQWSQLVGVADPHKDSVAAAAYSGGGAPQEAPCWSSSAEGAAGKPNLLHEEDRQSDGPLASSHNTNGLLTSQEVQALGYKMCDPVRGVRVHDVQKCYWRYYRQCFSGSDVVDWIIAHCAKVSSREQAAKVAQYLFTSGFFRPVTQTSTCFKDSPLLFCTFEPNNVCVEDMDYKMIKAIVEQMSDTRNGGVELKNRRYFFKTYNNCFLGSEAVTWLVDNVPLLESREQAVQFGQMLMNNGYIYHVTNSHPFGDSNYFYVFDKCIQIEYRNNLKLEYENEDVQKSGFLTFLTRGKDGAIEKEALRWFCLRKECLWWYSSSTATQPLGSIPLFDISLQVSKFLDDKEGKHSFEIITATNSVYTLVCCFPSLFSPRKALVLTHTSYRQHERLKRWKNGWQPSTPTQSRQKMTLWKGQK
ncbi:vacuolar membrane-associated protein iml1 [Balamuthia mandrillaris]